MCTFTFMPTASSGLILTSSRDEKKSRPTVMPAAYELGADTFYYPKDMLAGGTWLAASDKQRVVCLLNGAFEAHVYNPPYARSRGLIPLELLESANILDYWALMDLEGVEPFTVVVVEAVATGWSLNEMRWDGNTKYHKVLDASQPYIWSSATLYSAENRTQRQLWFDQWVLDNNNLNPDRMKKFHMSRHGDNQQTDLLMSREGGLQTTSVSQLLLDAEGCAFWHNDLLEERIKNLAFEWKSVYA